MMWMLGFGGFKLPAFSHLLTAQERIQYFGKNMPVSTKPFEVRRTLPGGNWAVSRFGILAFCASPWITGHFFWISKTKCAIYCAIRLNDLSRVFRGFCHVLMSRCWTKYLKHYFHWTCVIPRFLTIYKNTGVTGLWRGHCATGLVIFDAKIYQTRRCCRVCLKHDKEVCCAYPSKVFFPLGMFMMFAGSKKIISTKPRWFAEFFSGHVDADYPKVGDHLHHFW